MAGVSVGLDYSEGGPNQERIGFPSKIHEVSIEFEVSRVSRHCGDQEVYAAALIKILVAPEVDRLDHHIIRSAQVNYLGYLRKICVENEITFSSNSDVGREYVKDPTIPYLMVIPKNNESSHELFDRVTSVLKDLSHDLELEQQSQLATEINLDGVALKIFDQPAKSTQKTETKPAHVIFANQVFELEIVITALNAFEERVKKGLLSNFETLSELAFRANKWDQDSTNINKLIQDLSLSLIKIIELGQSLFELDKLEEGFIEKLKPEIGRLLLS
jgi:hypothetical protein